MIAFDPDLIDIKQDYELIQKPITDDISKGTEIKLSYEMTVPDAGGTAYIRITPQLRDFFKLCHDKHGVIGFEYDFDEAGLNFGLILKKEADDE